jgi:hypothetical protein
MPPSNDLLQTFKDAMAAFNGALTDLNYQNFQQYLYSSVLIQKVDDPSDFVSGPPASIIAYLDLTQASTKTFPQFDDGGHPHQKKHISKKHENIGDVTGNGRYQDNCNYATWIPIQYSFRFKADATGNWLLASALGTLI